MANEKKQVGTKDADHYELRCVACGKVLSESEVIDNGEYIVPVSKCCTAYIREFKVFTCGTTKV